MKNTKKRIKKNTKQHLTLAEKNKTTTEVKEIFYTYTIYVYSTNYSRMEKENAELWIWNENDNNHTGTAYPFTSTEILDGSMWLKTQVKLSSTQKIGIIFKSFGGSQVWNWQTQNLYYENQSELLETTLYIVEINENISIYTNFEDVQKNNLLSIMEMVVSIDNRLRKLEHHFELLQENFTSETKAINTMNDTMQEMLQNMVALDEGNRLILAKMLLKDMGD